MTTSEYIEKGTEALMGRTKKERVKDGVYGVCSLCLQDTFDLTTECTFDKAHCLSGVCKCFIYCLAGLRGNVTESVIKASKKRGFYGGVVKTEKTCPPWRIPKKARHRIETYAQCIIFPSSLKSQYRCEHFLTKTKNMHIDDVLKLCMVVLPFCVSKCQSLSLPYKLMYYTVCEYITASLATIVDQRVMDELYHQIVEFLSFSSAMLPPSEATFLKHEWCHVPDNMKKMGPFLSNNALALERFMAIFKKWVPRGGRNYNKTMSNAYVRYENFHDEKEIIELEKLRQRKANQQHSSSGEIDLFDDDPFESEPEEPSIGNDPAENSVFYLYPSRLIETKKLKNDPEGVQIKYRRDYFQLVHTVMMYEIDLAQRTGTFDELWATSSLIRLNTLLLMWKAIFQNIDEEDKVRQILHWFSDSDPAYLDQIEVFLSFTHDSTLNVLSWLSDLVVHFKGISHPFIVKLPEMCYKALEEAGLVGMPCIWSGVQYILYVQQKTPNGQYLFKSDISRVYRCFNIGQLRLQLPIHIPSTSVFWKASVFGTEMVARKATTTQSPETLRRYIANHWHERLNINSWCVMNQRWFEEGVDNVSEFQRFGMINYFFEIDTTTISIWDLPPTRPKNYQLVSVFALSSRQSVEFTDLNIIDINDSNIEQQQFCCLTDIDCTRIAMVVSDNTHKPFMLQSDNMNATNRAFVSSQTYNKAQFIEPLLLAPHKLCVRKAFLESGLI
jgi:hypothetical protein